METSNHLQLLGLPGASRPGPFLELPPERIRELFIYDPETGYFAWRTKASRRDPLKPVKPAAKRKHHEFCTI